MNKSESIAKLADALAKAQGAVKTAVKGKVNRISRAPMRTWARSSR